MTSKPHIDNKDQSEVDTLRGKQQKIGLDAPRRRNNLINRYTWALNVLDRMFRGTTEDNGWRDGDLRMAFRFGGRDYKPQSAAQAKTLRNHLKNAIWAAYRAELWDNASDLKIEEGDKDWYKLRNFDERGVVIDTINAEATRIFTEIEKRIPNFDTAAFKLWFRNLRKPVAL